MNGESSALSGENVSRIYGALRSRLNSLSVQNIRNVAAAAGIDVSRIPAASEARAGLGSRAEVMPVVDRLFRELSPEARAAGLQVMAAELIRRSPELREEVMALLGAHGFQFIDGHFVPVTFMDLRERQFLPSTSASELARAMTRLIDGDHSGAITAACGAVDLATQDIYRRHGLGDPGSVAFQAKVNTALVRLHVFEDMEREFVGLGMTPVDAAEAIGHLRRTTNHAAQALQVLRRTMGDVHGSHPALRRTAYDAIKHAAAICGLLEGQ